MLTVICYMYLRCKQNCLSRTLKFSKSKSASRLKNEVDMGIVVSEFHFVSSLCKILFYFIYSVWYFLELTKSQRGYHIGVIICTILKYQ